MSVCEGTMFSSFLPLVLCLVLLIATVYVQPFVKHFALLLVGSRATGQCTPSLPPVSLFPFFFLSFPRFSPPSLSSSFPAPQFTSLFTLSSPSLVFLPGSSVLSATLLVNFHIGFPGQPRSNGWSQLVVLSAQVQIVRRPRKAALAQVVCTATSSLSRRDSVKILRSLARPRAAQTG